MLAVANQKGRRQGDAGVTLAHAAHLAGKRTLTSTAQGSALDSKIRPIFSYPPMGEEPLGGPNPRRK